jgi:hypothetical protein
MFRRLFTLILMLACAFAPALPGRDAAAKQKADCCCASDSSTTCPRECAPPPAAPVRAPLTLNAPVDQRATAAKPALRIARVLFFHFVSLAQNEARPAVQPAPVRLVAAASVALFQAHCSLLI